MFAKFAMFKLSLAVILQIMQVAPPLEQTTITWNQGILGYNIPECCQVVLGE